MIRKKILITALTCAVFNTVVFANTINADEASAENTAYETEVSEEITSTDDESTEDGSNESIVTDDEAIEMTEEKLKNELLYSENSVLSEGLEYTRNLYYHPTYGNQREYILEYTPSDVTTLHFSGNKYIYQTNYIREIAQLNHQNENFVAAINADFFNMSTGVPDSAYIKDYELFTTDRDGFCLALTDEGEYFFDKPSVKIELIADDESIINVAHLNKEFSEYALYLYNSNYSQTTHIKSSYSEAVLVPYDDVLSIEEIIIRYNDEECNFTELFESIETEQELLVLIKRLEEKSGFTYIGDKFYSIVGVFPSIGYSEKLVVAAVNRECKNSEIPQNSYLLCGDSSSYGYIVDGMKVGETYELKVSGNNSFGNVIDAIGVGVMIVNNSEVIDNTSNSIYTSLQPRSAVGIKEDGTLIFYAADGRQKNKSAGLKLIDLANVMKSLGCKYAANLDGGGSTIVSASRPGFDSAETVNSPSGNTERRISNAFIFTNTLEKNKQAHSAHYYRDSIITFSDWLIELPKPIIADENGFEYVDGEERETEVTYSVERENSIIADGKLYINGESGKIDVMVSIDGTTQDTPAFSVYTVDVPDKIEISVNKTELAPYETAVLNADAFYKNLPVISGFESFVWSVKSSEEEFASGSFGKAEKGEFTPFKKGEEYTITASKGETYDSVTVYVDSYPFEDIENHWAVKEIYKLAKDGIVNGYPDYETGLFYYFPQRSYSRYEFVVMLARMTGIGSDIEVPVRASVKDDEITDVLKAENNDADIEGEERAETTDVNEKIELEVTESEIVPEEKSYEILDESVLPDRSGEQEENATDEIVIPDFYDWDAVPEWAYDAVYRLYVSGFLDGIMQTDEAGNVVFNGSDFITRADVMKVMGMLCEEAPEDYSTEMYSDLSIEQRENEYINNVLHSGIFSGYEDMTLRPLGFLTRAEAAAVFVRLENYLLEAEF